MEDTEPGQMPDSCFEPERRFKILRDIFDSLSEHIAVLDHTGRIVDANASWRRFAPGKFRRGSMPDRGGELHRGL